VRHQPVGQLWVIGFASGRAVLVREAHRQLRWLAIPAASTTFPCYFNYLDFRDSLTFTTDRS
jgi:hypothetical protein